MKCKSCSNDFTPVCLDDFGREFSTICDNCETDFYFCGACGFQYDRTEADKDGFHKLSECTAYAEELN
jgi:hypothetical protein